MLCILWNRSVPGLGFAVPEQDASGLFVIAMTFDSGHVFVALRCCSSWELFPSHQPLSHSWLLFQWDWTISTLPISAPCHWETGHLEGTGVSSEWWKGVNWLYFCLNLLFPLISTRLSVHFAVDTERILQPVSTQIPWSRVFCFTFETLVWQTQKWVVGLFRILGGS